MFNNILTTFTGRFDARFITNIFFPCFVFVMIILALFIVTFSESPDDVFNIWKDYRIEVQAFFIILFICLILFVALIISSLITPIIRLYEGYWVSGDQPSTLLGKWAYQPLEWAQDCRKGYYRQVLSSKGQFILENFPLHGISEKDRGKMLSNYNEIYYEYPPPLRLDEVMPTRLGNVLKNAELYPRLRYNIDTVLIMPRLYPLLPADFSGQIMSARGSLDMRITMSILGLGLTAFSFLGGLYLWLNPALIDRDILILFVATFFGGLIVSYISYISAINSAQGYGELVKVAFDFHRGKVIESLGFKKPDNLDAEFELWGDINAFIHRNIPGKAYNKRRWW